MADVIADELADMMGRTVEQHIEAYLWHEHNFGDVDPEPPPVRYIDMRACPDTAHPAVQRALRQAWSLAAATQPPPGAIRSRQATRNDRMVRAIGDGWSLIARTDGPVVLLLDEEAPGVPLQIDDAAQVPQLLDALTAAASLSARPSGRPPRAVSRCS